MDVEEYLRASMEGVSINDVLASVFAAVDIGGVYYIEEGQLHIGTSWDAEMEASAFTVTEDALTIDSLSSLIGLESFFVRVSE